MKRILVGYDGSHAADDAMRELIRARLGGAVEALVLSVADVWLPSELPVQASGTSDNGRTIGGILDRAHYPVALEMLEKAKSNATQGARFLSSLFPDWQIHSESLADSPGWALTQKARDWKANLVVVGAHSRSAFERFFFGSVAAKVTMESPCSVRISRTHPRHEEHKLRIIVAVDGSTDSQNAVDEVARRFWLPSTEIRVVAIFEPKLDAIASAGGVGEGWRPDHALDSKDWVFAMTKHFTEQLRDAHHNAEARVLNGDPKKVLVHQAETWDADCIFVGARGLNHGNRWLLGSVASAVSSRAPCSVEVVR